MCNLTWLSLLLRTESHTPQYQVKPIPDHFSTTKNRFIWGTYLQTVYPTVKYELKTLHGFPETRHQSISIFFRSGRIILVPCFRKKVEVGQTSHINKLILREHLNKDIKYRVHLYRATKPYKNFTSCNPYRKLTRWEYTIKGSTILTPCCSLSIRELQGNI